VTREEVQAITGGDVIRVDDRWDVLLPSDMSDADLEARRRWTPANMTNVRVTAEIEPRTKEPDR